MIVRFISGALLLGGGLYLILAGITTGWMAVLVVVLMINVAAALLFGGRR